MEVICNIWEWMKSNPAVCVASVSAIAATFGLILNFWSIRWNMKQKGLDELSKTICAIVEDKETLSWIVKDFKYLLEYIEKLKLEDSAEAALKMRINSHLETISSVEHEWDKVVEDCHTMKKRGLREILKAARGSSEIRTGWGVTAERFLREYRGLFEELNSLLK